MKLTCTGAGAALVTPAWRRSTEKVRPAPTTPPRRYLP